MTHFEHDLYEKNLPPDQFNRRWWDMVSRIRRWSRRPRVESSFATPAPKLTSSMTRPNTTTTRWRFVIKFQLHDHIARKILKQDPHSCNYYGNKEVGKFLWDLLRLGATRDWREVIREKTGEEVSTRAMLEYFAPLLEYLKKENAGRDTSW